jgi:hypothetical protein
LVLSKLACAFTNPTEVDRPPRRAAVYSRKLALVIVNLVKEETYFGYYKSTFFFRDSLVSGFDLGLITVLV